MVFFYCFTVFVVAALTFFLIIYFSELKREKELRTEYAQYLKDFKNVPMVISDIDALSRQLGLSPTKKPKISFEDEFLNTTDPAKKKIIN